MKLCGDFVLRISLWLSVFVSSCCVASPLVTDALADGNNGSEDIQQQKPVSLGSNPIWNFRLGRDVPAAMLPDGILALIGNQDDDHIRMKSYRPGQFCPDQCKTLEGRYFASTENYLYAYTKTEDGPNDCVIVAYPVQGSELGAGKCLTTPESFRRTGSWFFGFVPVGDDHLLAISFNNQAPVDDFTGDVWLIDAKTDQHQELSLPKRDVAYPVAGFYNKDDGFWAAYQRAANSDTYLCYYRKKHLSDKLAEPECVASASHLISIFQAGEKAQPFTLIKSSFGLSMTTGEKFSDEQKWLWQLTDSEYTQSPSDGIPQTSPVFNEGRFYFLANKQSNGHYTTPALVMFDLASGQVLKQLFFPVDSSASCSLVIASPVLDKDAGRLYVVVSSRECSCGMLTCDDERLKLSRLFVLDSETLEILDEQRLDMYVGVMPTLEVDSKLYDLDGDGSVLYVPGVCSGNDSRNASFFQCHQPSNSDGYQSYLLYNFGINTSRVEPSSCIPAPYSGCKTTMPIYSLSSAVKPTPTSTPTPSVEKHEGDGGLYASVAVSVIALVSGVAVITLVLCRYHLLKRYGYTSLN